MGPDHPDTATSLNNLASLYQSQGHYKEAEPLLKRALEITEKALGPDHPDTAKRLNNLATDYAMRQRYLQAESLFKKALGVLQRSLGVEHPDVVLLARNYADVLQKLGRGHEAHKLRKRFGNSR